MNDNEAKIVEAFIVKEKQERWKMMLNQAKKRNVCLNRLHNCNAGERRALLQKLLPTQD